MDCKGCDVLRFCYWNEGVKFCVDGGMGKFGGCINGDYVGMRCVDNRGGLFIDFVVGDMFVIDWDIGEVMVGNVVGFSCCCCNC